MDKDEALREGFEYIVPTPDGRKIVYCKSKYQADRIAIEMGTRVHRLEWCTLSGH
jgi:hypothetical protein